MSAVRSSARVLLAVTAAGLTCGGGVGPNFRNPEPPAGAGYSAADLLETQQFMIGRDIAFEWWELFQSSELDSLVKSAFKANPTLAAAQASLAQAQELVYAQRGFFFPALAAETQAERHKVSGNTNSSSTIGVQGNGVDLLPAREDPNRLPHNLPSY